MVIESLGTWNFIHVGALRRAGFPLKIDKIFKIFMMKAPNLWLGMPSVDDSLSCFLALSAEIADDLL